MQRSRTCAIVSTDGFIDLLPSAPVFHRAVQGRGPQTARPDCQMYSRSSDIVAVSTARLPGPSNRLSGEPFVASCGVIGRAGLCDLGPARPLGYRPIPPPPPPIPPPLVTAA